MKDARLCVRLIKLTSIKTDLRNLSCEMKVELRHVTHHSSGTLQFSRDVATNDAGSLKSDFIRIFF